MNSSETQNGETSINPTTLLDPLLSTPPSQYKQTVGALSDLISSTGLDRRASLELANSSLLRRLEEEYKESLGTQREHEGLIEEVVAKLLMGWEYVASVIVAVGVMGRSSGVLELESLKGFVVEEVCGCTMVFEGGGGSREGTGGVTLGGHATYGGSSFLKLSSLLLSRWGATGEGGEKLITVASYMSSFLSSFLPSSPTTVVSKITSSLCITLCGCKALLAFATLALLHVVLNHLSSGRLIHNAVNLLSAVWIVVGVIQAEEWLAEIQMVAVRVWLVNLFISSAILLYKRDVHENVPTMHLSLFNRSVPVLALSVGAVVGLLSAEMSK